MTTKPTSPIEYLTHPSHCPICGLFKAGRAHRRVADRCSKIMQARAIKAKAEREAVS